jgi:hypothetical protein
MEKHIPKIVGSWLAGTYDRDRAVAGTARDGIKSFLDNDEKVAIFWKRCQVQILEYAQEAIKETPQTLSDERTLSADDVQAKYFRVVGSSISLIINLLVRLSREDILKHQDKYAGFLSTNKKLWSLAACEDSFVRRTTDQLLIVCLDKQQDIVESELETVSHEFIAEALRSSQASSAFQLLQALGKLTSKFPHSWTSAYKGKKSPLSRLRHFVEKGSQGGPPEFWQALRSLLSLLPAGVLPSDIDASMSFLKSFRDGVGSREEPRSNASEGWSSYFEVATILVRNLPEPITQGKLLKESVYPVFEQYLHPIVENSRWSIGNDTALLAKAYIVCASVNDSSLRQSFTDEWARLADNFISRILTSLPEQSTDFHKSQYGVAAEGHRWFGLVAKAVQEDASNEAGQMLVLPSKNIITAALKALVTRNGKPYSAAAAIESALRLSPILFQNAESPGTLGLIKSFLGSHLPKLILSPSSSHLVSILNLLRSFPDQQVFFEEVWQSTVDGLLLLSEDGHKLKAITVLISDDAVAELSQRDLQLQDYLLEESKKAVLGDSEAWPLFEAVTSFGTLSRSAEKKLVDEILQHLDPNDANLNEALNALVLISNKKPDLLRRENKTHVTLVTKMLAITELEQSSSRVGASSVEIVLHNLSKIGEDRAGGTLILHVIRENLENASHQSLR